MFRTFTGVGSAAARVAAPSAFRSVPSRAWASSAARAAPKGSFAKKGSIVAGAVGIATGLAFYAQEQAHASDALAPPAHPWDHNSMFNSFDHGSIRRGFQVYREVCSACHSLDLIAWRNLVGVVGTEDEVKEWAQENDYEDGPNDIGEMYDRPGALTDHMPKPYKNDNEARAGNNGALPPDLSLIKKARVGGEDYLFALLTGYREAPHGVALREGMYYNPYFPGGAIGMEQALHDEMIDYEDGTTSSISQMAKDVSVFLTWTAEPEHDERKRMGLKAFFVIALMAIPTLYFKRLKWSVLKTRQLRFTKF